MYTKHFLQIKITFFVKSSITAVQKLSEKVDNMQ